MSEELPREVAKRILSLKKDSEESKAFAARIGLSPSVVSNWRNQGHGASLEKAATVLAHHEPRLSPAWLLAGLPPRYLPEGEEMEDAVRRELREKGYRLHVIGKIADGKISLTTLQDAEEIRRLESRGATDEEIAASLRASRSAATAEAGS